MANILVSGLTNTETTVRVRQFPVIYYPIDYPFFGVNTAVSGVAYNISKALKTLGDDVTLLTMTGRDFPAEYIQSQLCTAGIGTDWVKPRLKETPNSVALYDGEGKRQIYCDLKDIQETPYDFPEDICRDADVVAACNINFSRPLLHQAKALGKTVATDVPVLSDIHDEFNREFMACADILFLSNEGIPGDYRDFLRALGDTYGNRIIVLGRGAKGAAMYLREEGRMFALPAVQGILDGYQTMDTLAGLNFGAGIALNIRARGVTESRAVEGGTIRAGFIAGGLMLVVYAMLGHAGAETGTVYPGLATGAEVLTALAQQLFGRAGLVLIAAIFVIACFNTCVGLIACVGQYFHQLLPRIPYPAIAAFFAVASMLVSNLGLAAIIRLSTPVLNAIYPAAVVLILLSFMPGLEKHRAVYPLCMGLTALQSIAAALPLGAVSAAANALPLGSMGFGWVLPALAGLAGGLLLNKSDLQ